jgi:DNA-binding beta-propeller fold protein YncE
VPAVSLAVPEVANRVAPVAVIGPAGDISDARGVAADSRGNVYIGDRARNRVVLFGPEGKLLRSLGRAATTEVAAGEFKEIRDVAVGADGSLYVLDGPDRVHAYGRSATLLPTHELGINGAALATGPDGTIYVADPGRSRVVAIAKDGTAARALSGTGGANGPLAPLNLDQPLSVAPGPGGRGGEVYALDLRGRIALLGAGGEIVREWPLPISRELDGGRIAAAPDGRRVYMTDPDRARVAVLDTAAGTLSYFGGRGKGAGSFVAPRGVAVDKQGRVYVLDSDNTVQVFSLQEGE